MTGWVSCVPSEAVHTDAIHTHCILSPIMKRVLSEFVAVRFSLASGRVACGDKRSHRIAIDRRFCIEVNGRCFCIEVSERRFCLEVHKALKPIGGSCGRRERKPESHLN